MKVRITSVYNSEEHIAAAIDNILKQTFTGFEFIIINDGSTDNTAKRLASHNDPRVIIVINEANIGLTKSLNKGLEIARGKYIARMEADDIYLPQRLAMQVEFLDAHPEVGIMYGAVQIIDSSGNPSYIFIKIPTEHNFYRWSLCFDDTIVHPTVMNTSRKWV